MTVKIITGNALTELREQSSESVHCCVVSPPYWGLRDYGVEPQVWGGDQACKHVFGADKVHRETRGTAGSTLEFPNNKNVNLRFDVNQGAFCNCGAWRGSFGLEPTPELFIDHLVQIFEEVRRVLRADGTLWLNLGDSYASGTVKGNSGNGTSTLDSDGYQDEAPRPRGRPAPGATSTAGEGKRRANRDGTHAGKHTGMTSIGPMEQPNRMPLEGLKPKDMVGIPWMAAFALRRAGWWLRQDIIWAKPNPMPESIGDRCTKAHEYLFLLTKSEQYYYDAVAISEPASENSVYSGNNRSKKAPENSAIRSKDSWYESTGAKMATRNKRSVWTVATQPFAEAHFACVDDATEALTPTGWRLHAELSDGDTIAAYDQKLDALVWQPATFHRYQFDGDLVAINKRDSSQRLTPNHRCLVRQRGGNIRVVKASDLKPSMQIPVSAPLSVLTEPGYGVAFAALLGWYVTEGEKRRGNIIRIHQSASANPGKVTTIQRLLVALGADFTLKHHHRQWRGRPAISAVFSIRGEIADRLFAASPRKEIDWRWLSWPTADVRAFLDAVIDGDGHRRPDGRSSVIQKSRAFVDALQALGTRLGWRGHIAKRAEGCHVIYFTKGMWLTLRGTDGKHTPIGRERYTGTVWCPNVRSKFWLARRDGKPFITGNTFPPALIEDCIKAGTSARGCCPKCAAPWERITAKVDTGRTQKMPDGMATYAGGHTAIHKDGREKGESGNPVLETVTLGWWPGCRCDGFDASLPPYPPKPSRVEIADEGSYKVALRAWLDACAVVNERRREMCDMVAKMRPVVPCTVLDPFGGAGTTGLVADRLQRDAVLIELNPDYAEMARRRIDQDQGPLFARAAE